MADVTVGKAQGHTKRAPSAPVSSVSRTSLVYGAPQFELARIPVARPSSAATTRVASEGVASARQSLPHLSRIQASFGHHDLRSVRAAVGGAGATAATELGARAFTKGQRIAFREAPDLHLAAHEAAHVVQQRGGVQLKDGVGREGDRYEREADAVADLVVQGRSAETLLDRAAPGRATDAVQARCACGTCATCSGKEDDDETVQLAPEPVDAPSAKDAAILAILDVPVSASDAAGQRKRVADLTAVFMSLTSTEASDLYARLASRHGHLAKVFHYKLSTATRLQLFNVLGTRMATAARMAPMTAPPVAAPKPKPEHAPWWASRNLGSGEPNRAMRDGISAEKWDPDSERSYRAQGRTGLADAMRRCRIEGNGTCNFVLTEKEAMRWYYKSQQEPSWGNCPGGPSSAQPTTDKKSPAPGVAMGGAVAQRATTGAAAAEAEAAGAAAKARHLTVVTEAMEAEAAAAEAATAAEVGTAEAVVTTEAAEAGAASVAPEILAGAAPVAIGVGMGIAAGIQASMFHAFKTYLEAHYHIYTLDDPLARCIQGCHYANTPKPRPFDLDDTVTLLPRTSPLTPMFPSPDEYWWPGRDQTPTAPPTTAGPSTRKKPVPVAPPDVDIDEEPAPEPKTCEAKATDCKPVLIPRKGGDLHYTRRHNRGADNVSAKHRAGQDVCINGKAFDGLMRDTLWEVKGHAWTYAKIYQQPAMAKTILEQLVAELVAEKAIAEACGYKFKVGVCDAGLLAALSDAAPELVVEVIDCAKG